MKSFNEFYSQKLNEQPIAPQQQAVPPGQATEAPQTGMAAAMHMKQQGQDMSAKGAKTMAAVQDAILALAQAKSPKLNLIMNALQAAEAEHPDLADRLQNARMVLMSAAQQMQAPNKPQQPQPAVG